MGAIGDFTSPSLLERPHRMWTHAASQPITHFGIWNRIRDIQNPISGRGPSLSLVGDEKSAQADTSTTAHGCRNAHKLAGLTIRVASPRDSTGAPARTLFRLLAFARRRNTQPLFSPSRTCTCPGGRCSRHPPRVPGCSPSAGPRSALPSRR